MQTGAILSIVLIVTRKATTILRRFTVVWNAEKDSAARVLPYKSCSCSISFVIGTGDCLTNVFETL
jgi:hypothetical protein